MRGRLKELNKAMFDILNDPRASRLERLEAGRIIASLHGVLIPEGVNESTLSTKTIVQLKAAKTAIAEKMFKRREQRKKQNRRAYLRRRIAAIEASVPATEAQQPAAKGQEQP